MKEVDVLFLLDNSFGNAGDNRVYRALKVFQQNGFKVAIVCMQHPNLPMEETIDGIDIYRMHDAQIMRPHTLFGYRQKLVANIINKFKFKAVYANDWTMLNLSTRIKKALPHVIHIYDTHELLMDYHFDGMDKMPWINQMKAKLWIKYQQHLESVDIKNTDIAISIAYSVATLLHFNYKLKQAPYVVRNIPEFGFFNDKLDDKIVAELDAKLVSLAPNKHHLIFIGDYMHYHNGIEILFNALTKLPKDVKLVMVGTNRHKSHFDKIKSDLKIEDRVIELGRYPQKYLMYLKSKVSISVAPTQDYGFFHNYYSLPNKLFDSIKIGFPLITSSLPEHKLVVDTYKVGESFDAFNTENGTAELVELYSKVSNNLAYYQQNVSIAQKEVSVANEFAPIIKHLRRLMK
jgi:hypothetical protein